MLYLSVVLFTTNSIVITYLLYQNFKLYKYLKKIHKKINYSINGNTYYHINNVPYANIIENDLECGYLLDDNKYIML